MKAFVCRCEDITESECRAAIREGYTGFEDLKRFLGLATGPCQGKACVVLATRLIADATHRPPEAIDVMTFRPPLRPIALGVLAAPDARRDGAEGTERGRGTTPAASEAGGPSRGASRIPDGGGAEP